MKSFMFPRWLNLAGGGSRMILGRSVQGPASLVKRSDLRCGNRAGGCFREAGIDARGEERRRGAKAAPKARDEIARATPLVNGPSFDQAPKMSDDHFVPFVACVFVL